ncbi:LytTR family DNA-binding domain-containing protein [Lachnospiraceae bacterium OttesenSCG-928-D06]|nr:LytTR family DNA-binding domain-containing protein [Lachnospiraceae bacterium OttesenSCG-928-D06]
MIPIYLCDDDPVWLTKISNMIKSFLSTSMDPNMNIVSSHTTPDSLLSDLLANPPRQGIYFLDILLRSNIDGLDLALKIREIDPRGFIVFVTTNSEMALKTFEYHLEVLDYVVKDQRDIEQQVFKCLSHIREIYHSLERLPTDKIVIHSSPTNLILTVSEILFIETIKGTHKRLIHSMNSLDETEASLSTLQKQLGEDFIFCHKSFLINLRQVVKINRERRVVIMKNKEECLCSIRHLPEVSKRILALYATRDGIS